MFELFGYLVWSGGQVTRDLPGTYQKVVMEGTVRDTFASVFTLLG